MMTQSKISNKKRDLTIGFSIVLTSFLVVISPQTPLINQDRITLITLLVILSYTFYYHDSLFKKLFIFGLFGGFTELIADWYLVEITKSLIYDIGGFYFLKSPLHMPFAWNFVLIQLGYIGWRITGLLGPGRGMLLSGGFGAVVIPFYEEIVIIFAKSWHYEGVKMLGHTPYYIIGGEFLIVAGVTYLVAKYIDKKDPALLGVIGGLWILISYAAAYRILK